MVFRPAAVDAAGKDLIYENMIKHSYKAPMPAVGPPEKQDAIDRLRIVHPDRVKTHAAKRRRAANWQPCP